MPAISGNEREYRVSSLFAAMTGVPRALHFVAGHLTLAFAVTDSKLQGKTLNELMLSLAPRPFPPRLDLKGYYAIISRGRRITQLRALHRPPEEDGGLSHILALQYVRTATGAWARPGRQRA